MKRINVAMVSKTKRLSWDELVKVSAALNRQLKDHFKPVWNIPACVKPFSRVKEIPKSYWPLFIQDHGEAGFSSYHSTKNGKPFVVVIYSDEWTLGASHDLLEMLVDPYVRATVRAPSIVRGE